MLSRRNFLCRIPLVAGVLPAAQALAAEPHAGHAGRAGHLGTVGTVDPAANGFDPQAMLRDFDRGVVRGGVREWALVADEKEIEVAPGVKYAAWAYNGRVPGPTLRARDATLRSTFSEPSSASLRRRPSLARSGSGRRGRSSVLTSWRSRL